MYKQLEVLEPMFLEIGTQFSSTNKLGKTSWYEIVRYYEERGLRFCTIKAIGVSQKECQIDLERWKKNNPSSASVQRTTLEKCCTIDEITAEWFSQRKITILKGGMKNDV